MRCPTTAERLVGTFEVGVAPQRGLPRRSALEFLVNNLHLCVYTRGHTWLAKGRLNGSSSCCAESPNRNRVLLNTLHGHERLELPPEVIGTEKSWSVCEGTWCWPVAAPYTPAEHLISLLLTWRGSNHTAVQKYTGLGESWRKCCQSCTSYSCADRLLRVNEEMSFLQPCRSVCCTSLKPSLSGEAFSTCLPHKCQNILLWNDRRGEKKYFTLW